MSECRHLKLQLHMVLYNCRYRSLEEADSRPDGVVVIVILIQVRAAPRGSVSRTRACARVCVWGVVSPSGLVQ